MGQWVLPIQLAVAGGPTLLVAIIGIIVYFWRRR
jgi:hypothetical protein